jgi:hypothetical protein
MLRSKRATTPAVTELEGVERSSKGELLIISTANMLSPGQ